MVVYRCRVITHTSDWICERTYRDFEEFKHSLPFGTSLFFKTQFPYPLLPVPYVGTFFKLGGVEIDISEVEKRRQLLDEWMRELTMSEKCMSNADILQKVHSFVAADKTKPSTEPGRNSNATSAAMTPPAAADVPSSSSLAKSSVSPLSCNATVDKHPLFLTIKRIRKFLPSNFPVTVAQLDEMLSTGPFRLDVADFKEASGGLGTIDKDDDDQLRKDLSRDRIVINGRRFQGGGSSSSSSSSSFQEIVDACSNTVTELMSSAQLLPLASPFDSDTFVKSLLRQLSRTESAFLSLCLLNTIVDLPGSSSVEDSNIVLVPEAILAEPMQLTIELLERKPTTMNKTNVPVSLSAAAMTMNREYCIDCELNTSTVYRFCDDMSMSTLLQCRVVYSKRVYGMLGCSGSTSITEKAGKSHLVFIRETKTTARDWKLHS